MPARGVRERNSAIARPVTNFIYLPAIIQARLKAAAFGSRSKKMILGGTDEAHSNSYRACDHYFTRG
jgi:hypothetical protein